MSGNKGGRAQMGTTAACRQSPHGQQAGRWAAFGRYRQVMAARFAVERGRRVGRKPFAGTLPTTPLAIRCS